MAIHEQQKSKIHQEDISYRHEQQELEGRLAYSAEKKGKKPGVLIVHEWKGVNAFVKLQADRLAELGYVGFAVDIYGKGVYAKSPEEAAKFSTSYRSNIPLMRGRMQAAYEVLKKHPEVDEGKIAVMGYCFGGTCALELGRSGADVKAIVSFHGGLATANPQDAKNIKGKVLALIAGEDCYCSSDEVLAFQDEMRQAKIDWQTVTYGGAKHSFTVPEADKTPELGIGYHESADKRSWLAMKNFFEEVFSSH